MSDSNCTDQLFIYADLAGDVTSKFNETKTNLIESFMELKVSAMGTVGQEKVFSMFHESNN